MNSIFYIVIFLLVAFISINVLRNTYLTLTEGFKRIKGIKSASSSASKSSSSKDVIGENSKNFANAIKNASNAIKDELEIKKYTDNYETIILNIDDLLNNLMLETTLNLDVEKPLPTIQKLSVMQQSKSALISIMEHLNEQ